jgi:glycosyltransferase involved in cell wall biosynthesis
MSVLPKFSIVTVTRNNEVGLRATLESVALQSDRAFELIIIDGHSTDQSAQVVEEFQSLVTRFEQDSGEGIYGAMNQGVSLATGEWVIFMNAGDCFAHAEVLQQFASGGDVDLAFGRAQTYTGEAKLPYQGMARIWENMPFSHQALFCRTQILNERPFDLSFRIAGDFDLVMDLYQQGKKFESLDLDVAIADGGGISDTLLVRRVRECYRAARRYHLWNKEMHLFYLRKLRWARAREAEVALLNG